MAGKTRTLMVALAEQLQLVDGNGDSGVDLSAADCIHFGQWDRLPEAPPVVFVYHPAGLASAPRSALHIRNRAPRIHLDIWHDNGTSEDEMHLNTVDLKDEVLPLLEDLDWIKTLRAGDPRLDKLELERVESALFPGHLYGQAETALLRLALHFTWRTPCHGGS